MGEIRLLKTESCRVKSENLAPFDFDQQAEAADERLAGQIDHAWAALESRLTAIELDVLRHEVCGHFEVMEEALCLLYRQRSPRYKMVLRSYMALKLAMLRSKLLKNELLTAFLML